jgi:DNA-binding MarR family transcriptional regulator
MDLDRLAMASDAFSAQYAEPSSADLHHFRLLLEVARCDGRRTYRQLQQGLLIDNSSISRTVNALGETHRTGRPGLGLLTTYPDPDEGRRNIVALSPKGQAFVRQLLSI